MILILLSYCFHGNGWILQLSHANKENKTDKHQSRIFQVFGHLQHNTFSVVFRDTFPSLGTDSRFLPLGQSTATSKAVLRAYRSLTNTKCSLQVKQRTWMRDVCVTIVTNSEPPLISLLAGRFARAGESYRHIKITPTDIFSHGGSRKTTACTENKFSNCFQFLLFHWLRRNPAASHSSRLQLSFFLHSLSTPFLQLLWASQPCRRYPAGCISERSRLPAVQHNPSGLHRLIISAKSCSLCRFVGNTKQWLSCTCILPSNKTRLNCWRFLHALQ